MSVAREVAAILGEHTTLELECIDRMYLNLYVPILQREAGVAHFWRSHRGASFPSAALMGPMTRTFVGSIERFAECEGIPLFRFERGRRKDEVAQEYLRSFDGDEGVLFIGKAQEKTPSQVQLIFDRRVTRRTPGRFRTRVITAVPPPRAGRRAARDRHRALEAVYDGDSLWLLLRSDVFDPFAEDTDLGQSG